MPCLSGAAEAYIGHLDATALELSPDTRIDTLGSPPAFRYCNFPVTLVALEALRALLHDLLLDKWCCHDG